MDEIPAKKPRRKAPESPTLDCTSCAHFHEEMRSEDEVRWGACWRYPPQMMCVETADGPGDPAPVVTSVVLPYVCGELKAKQ